MLEEPRSGAPRNLTDDLMGGGTPAEIFLDVFDIYAETGMSPLLHEVTAPSLVLTG